MSDFEQWWSGIDAIPSDEETFARFVWQAALSSLQGEQAAELCKKESQQIKSELSQTNKYDRGEVEEHNVIGANGCVLREYEQSHTVQGQSVVDNIPLRHECNGASDYCMHCGIDVYDEKGLEPCDGLEKVRRSQINPSTVTAFGCEKESEGLETCKQWCQGLHCPYVRTEVYAAIRQIGGAE